MDGVELEVQKNIVSFCKVLPGHVDLWRSVLKETVKHAESLVNQAEQLRHVERANVKYLESFEQTQNKLQFLVLSGIEEQISSLRTLIDKLNKSNQDLRNKLVILEKSTLNLNWELESTVITGSGSQPSLHDLLQYSLRFWTFFSKIMKNINESFKLMDVRNEKSMRDLELSFKVDLDDKILTYFLALTQYINNENAIK